MSPIFSILVTISLMAGVVGVAIAPLTPGMREHLSRSGVSKTARPLLKLALAIMSLSQLFCVCIFFWGTIVAGDATWPLALGAVLGVPLGFLIGFGIPILSRRLVRHNGGSSEDSSA